MQCIMLEIMSGILQENSRRMTTSIKFKYLLLMNTARKYKNYFMTIRISTTQLSISKVSQNKCYFLCITHLFLVIGKLFKLQ